MSGLQSTCDQSNSIIRKGAASIASAVLNGNLPGLHISLGRLRTSSVNALVFEGFDSMDREVFGRVVIGNPPSKWAFSCSTELNNFGLPIGSVQSQIDIILFAGSKLQRELGSILFFWFLALIVIVVSNYRALRVLGSINESLESFAHQEPDSLNQDLSDSLIKAIASVPRNPGTQVILDCFSAIIRSLAEVAEIRMRLSRAEDKAKLAKQVGHDIRSPLTALRLLMDKSENLSAAEQDLLRSCYERVDKVAQNLLSSPNVKDTSNPQMSVDLISSITEVVREKQLQHPQVNWVFNSDRGVAFAYGDKGELQRILSNVMNNAIEAQASQVNVNVSISSEKNQIISITDNGEGIPDTILTALQSGQTITTKSNGHGLGLSHARITLQQFGGDLTIGKSIRNGAEVTIRLRVGRALSNSLRCKKLPGT